MKNSFLVVLKNPSITVMVDNFDVHILKESCFLFTEEGLLTFIFKSVDSNISYIKEISKQQEEEFLTQIKAIKDKAQSGRIVKPEFLIPTKKGKSN